MSTNSKNAHRNTDKLDAYSFINVYKQMKFITIQLTIYTYKQINTTLNKTKNKSI